MAQKPDQRARRDVVAPPPQQDQSGDAGRRRRKGQLLRQHDGVVGVEAGHEDEDQDEVDPAEPGGMADALVPAALPSTTQVSLLNVRFLAAEARTSGRRTRKAVAMRCVSSRRPATHPCVQRPVPLPSASRRGAAASHTVPIDQRPSRGRRQQPQGNITDKSHPHVEAYEIKRPAMPNASSAATPIHTTPSVAIATWRRNLAAVIQLRVRHHLHGRGPP